MRKSIPDATTRAQWRCYGFIWVQLFVSDSGALRVCRQIGGVPMDDLTTLLLAASVLFLAVTIYRLISKL